MFKKIKTKLLLWYIGITFIILVGFSYAIIQTFIYQNIKTVDTKLLAIAYDIEHDLDKYLSGEGKYFDEEEEFFIQNLDIAIIKKDKDKYSIVLASKPNLLIRTSSEEFATYKMKNSIKRVLYYKAKYYKEFYIQIGTTLEDKINEPINNLKNDIFLLVPLIFILSLFAGYFVISKALRPVNQVIEEVNNIDASDFEKRIRQIGTRDEIDDLIFTFNKMLNRLEESYNKVKRFSNDVSHELKTPLTVIRTELEIGMRKQRDIDEYKRIIKSAYDETIALQELIDALLFISTADKQMIQKNFTSVILDKILMDVINDNIHLLDEKKIELKIIKLDNVTLKADEVLLRILFNNLLQNAIKYSKNDGVIELQLTQYSFEIKDYGIGIKEEDIKNIFDRFYMVDTSRNKKGFGLGLSIVKNIVEIHNYFIECKSEFEKYTLFKISFS